MRRVRLGVDHLFARGAGAAVVAAVSLFCSEPVIAQPRAFHWSAPQECPSPAAATLELERAMRVAPSGGELRAEVRVAVTARKRRYVAVVSQSAPAAERKLTAGSCEELLEAVALAVAMSLAEGSLAEPAGGNSAPASASASTGPAAPPAEPAATSPVADSRAPAESTAVAPSSALAWGLEAEVLGDAGSLPAATAGGSVGVWLSGGPLEGSLSVGALLPRGGSGAGAGGGSADVGLSYAQLTLCTPIAAGLWPLWACGALEAGRMWGRGRGVDLSRTGSGLWLAPGAGLHARWARVGPVSLRVGLSLLVPTRRDDFVLNGADRVHRAQSLVARLNLSMRIPL